MSKNDDHKKLPWVSTEQHYVGDMESLRLTAEDFEKYNLQRIDLDEDVYEKVERERRPSKNFWKRTRVGRFFSGRTKAGRAFRRVGLGAIGVGSTHILGVDLTEILQVEGSGGNLDQQIEALTLIKEIVLYIGAVIIIITKGSDAVENYGEKADELKAKEDIDPILRKLISEIKNLGG